METVQMTRDEIAARTGRFAQLQPMEFMKNDTTVSQAAKDIILARKLMPVVLERTQSAFGNDAPIYNAAGRRIRGRSPTTRPAPPAPPAHFLGEASPTT